VNIVFIKILTNKKKLIFRLILIIIILFTSQLISANESLQNNELIVYVNFHEEKAKRLLDLFSFQNGIDYTFLKMSLQNTNKRVIDEKESPRADIILGGPADNHQLLSDMNLLKKYKSPEAANISEKFKSEAGFWTGIYLGPLSIAVNEKLW
jgi:iron(III) transport system substrate-binding protein